MNKKSSALFAVFIFGIFIAGVAAEEAVPTLISANIGDPKAIAEAYAKETPTYKAKGSNLTFVKQAETVQGIAFTFTYAAKNMGFGPKSASYYYSSSAIKKFTRTLVVIVKDGKVISAILDNKYDEVSQRFLTTSRLTSTPRGTTTSGMATVRTNDQARTIAEAWVKQSPTYKADGFSLAYIDWKTDATNRNAYIISLSFKTNHPGYGSKITSSSRQITGHRIEVKVESSKVLSAVIDAKWDELNQKEYAANKKVGLVSMTYQPKRCEKTSWQTWYEEQKNRFSTVPKEEDLIISYYTTVYNYLVTNMEKVDVASSCSQCGCPLPYAFTTQIRARDEARLKNQGWTRA